MRPTGDNLLLDLLANKVVLDVDVLRPVDVVLGQRQASLVVSLDLGRLELPNPSSLRMMRSHTASLAVSVSAMYSASVLDVAIVFWYLDAQATGPLASRNT